MMIPRRDFGMSLFDDMFKDPFFEEGRTQKKENFPMKTDIIEKDGKYELAMDLPGYEKKDINIEVEDGYLTISATKVENNDEENKKYVHKERYIGKCSRSFFVGEDINEQEIKASFNNGTLCLEFPKVETKQIEKKKTIEIQ